jgi:hypothetical protein
MRTLSPSLQDAIDSPVRLPDFKIYAFDNKLDDYTAIINGTYTQTPLDLTDFCSEISWKPSQLSFTLQDENGDFHPDTGQYKEYMKDGAILRLLEGDVRVDIDEWAWTFTGSIRGQIGWTKGLRPSSLVAKVVVYNRDNCQAYKRRSITTREYTAGTDLGWLCQDLGINFMGLSAGEVLIPYNLGRTLMHKTNQLVQVAPWDGLTSVLEVVSLVPFFNGEGRLTTWDKNLARSPNVNLSNYTRIYQVDIPQQTGDVVNRVVVIFLDSNLTEVEGSYQCLGTASITTGFFTPKEEIKCYWSDDRKQRARNTFMKTIKSVNDNLLPIGHEDYDEDDIYSGTITITIDAWVSILATVMLVEYLVTAAIPDTVVVFETVSVGRILQAQALVVILLLMMSLGSAQYEIWGVPYDLAYLEKRSIAVEYNIPYYEENEKEIKNDFIGSHDQADTVAVTELIFEKSSGSPRKVLMDDYLQLEIGDIFQVPDGRRFFIKDMSKSIKRGEVPKLQIEGFRVLKA